MRIASRRMLSILLVISLLAAVPLALAAQETPVETEQGPSGLMVLAFLLGVGGIIIVGGMMLARDSFQPEDEPET